MTITEFRLEIAGLLNRDPAKFVVNGTDLIVNAVNRGMSVAQRLINFERLRTTVGPVSVAINGGADISGLNINVIKAGYIEFTQNNSILPIQFTTKNQYLERLRRNVTWSNRTRLPNDNSRIGFPFEPIFYKQNNQIFVWPTDSNIWQGQTTVNLGLDVISKDNQFSYLAAYSLLFVGDIGQATPVFPDNTNVDGSYIKLPQVGLYLGQPLFSNGASCLFYRQAGINPNPGNDFWMVGDGPVASTGWKAPVNGPNGLDSSLPWLPVGITPTAGNYYQRYAPASLVNYVVGTQPLSFWLDECQEWLQLYVIQYLQSHYIKDKSGWPVTQQMVSAAWQGVVSWNDSISDQEVPQDLD